MTNIFAALGVAVCGCSTAPEVKPLAPGERVEIAYRDENAAMSLRNESASAPTGRAQDPGLKIVTDDDVASLLEALTRLGFFDGRGQAIPEHAKAALVVQRNGQTWVRARMPLAQTTPDEIEQFHVWVEVFRHVYDQTPAFRSDPNITTKDLFEQSHRLEENARNATSGHRSGT